jgi:predicted transcriptional regulator
MLSKRRDKLHIVTEILEISKRGALKTEVMYKANLSFTQLNEYLNFMLRIGLLEKIERAGDRTVYAITGKGRGFIVRYNEIRELTKSNDLQK